jgi:hypothetical protein
MGKFCNYWAKNWHIWVLVGLMFMALGVRAWNIEDSIYFRMDQARDATLIKTAFEGGVGELPLLGPRAAGSFLRLGPIFYYFQFLSAKAFSSVEPYVLAFPDLLFSILTIPLFYYFLRNFFSKKVSLLVVCIFSSSFILTQYARFAWNPNSIPFWALLTLLGAYKTVVVKSPKKAGLWLVVTAFGYAIASQLHFTALLALPLVIASFWIFNWPKQVKFKFWVLALGVLVFFYIPMAISEVYTGFDNAHQFLYALSIKGADDVTLAMQLEESLRLHAKYYSMMLTSYGNLDDKEFVLIFVFMLLFSTWRFMVIYKSKKSQAKKAFIHLTLCWFLVFVVLYSKLAMDISKPRFWLLIAPLPYIFLALLFQWFVEFKYKKIAKILVLGVSGFLILVNSYAVGIWYYSFSKQKEITGIYTRDLELKQSDLIGIKQMKTVASDWIAISKKTGKQLCYQTETTYLRPYEYIFDIYYSEIEKKRIKFAEDSNDNCTFVSVRHGDTKGKKPIEKNHLEEFEIVSKKTYNKMVVWELQRKEAVMTEVSSEEKNITTKEVLLKEQQKELEAETEAEKEAIKTAEEQEDREDDEGGDDGPEKLPRKERVFWKHVFGGEKYED